MNILRFCHSTLKMVLYLSFVCFGYTLSAQTVYKVTYHVSELKSQGSIDNLDERGKRFTKQVIARARDLNYILISNQNESYFEREDILSPEDDSPYKRMLSTVAEAFVSFHEAIYVNHEEDSIILVNHLVSQDFTVKRDFFNFNWIITDDYKKILGFNAKKAEGSYFDPVIKEEHKIEAWFIPSIPLQSGPDIFMGLPGLIAEVNLKGAVVTVKKIESNSDLDIQKIDSSKAMTQQEYEDLIEKLTKKVIDNLD